MNKRITLLLGLMVLLAHVVAAAIMLRMQASSKTMPPPTPPIQIQLLSSPPPQSESPVKAAPAKPTPLPHQQEKPVKVIAPRPEKAVEKPVAKPIGPPKPTPKAIAAPTPQAKALDEPQVKAPDSAHEAEIARQQALAAQKAAVQKANAQKGEQQKAEQSNTPVSFSAGQASWAQRANFSFPESARQNAKPGQVFRVVLRLTVDKQGRITGASVASSSGNALIDRTSAQQVMRGRLNPFTKNGAPVIGIVNFPVEFKMP